MIIRLVKWKKADSFIHEKIKKKVCSKCKKEKKRSDFWADTKTRDGVTAMCKVCTNEKRAQTRLAKQQDPFNNFL